MTQESEKFVTGNLVSVRNLTDSGCWLGLIVDQIAATRWVQQDPCIEYNPSKKEGFIITRILGRKLTEGLNIGRTGLPYGEPHTTITVRWAYVQLNQAYVIAGPDVASIENFLKHSRTCASLGMEGGTFFHDVALVAEYLRGVKREKEAISHFERQFFLMLAEVLPP